MPQISIIKKSDIQEARRFDAEFFKPEYLEIEKKLKKINNNLLDNLITKLTDYHANGSYQILKQHVDLLDEPDYALMIRTVDFETDNFENNVKYVSENAYNFLNKTKLYGGEIIINKIGNAGRVYFMPYLNRKVSLGMNQFMMRANDKINNYFLYIFLISKFGKKIIERRISGAVPLSIDKQSVKNITIPILPKSFQLQIEKIVKSAYEKQTQSKQLYKQAEEILLKELDLLNYKPEHILSFETTKKETDEAGRFDAEYFQPKYEEIIKKIEKYEGGFDVVKNILNFNKKNFFPKENEFYNYIPLSRVSNSGEIEIPEKEFGKNLPTRARRKVKQGEIILSSISGSLETSAIIEKEHENFIVSNGFYVFNSEKINSETLLVLFKSKIIIQLLQRISKGAILGGYDLTAFEKFKIPLINLKIQKQIAEKIKESYKLRKESKGLLEKAKRRVEKEIEKEAGE